MDWYAWLHIVWCHVIRILVISCLYKVCGISSSGTTFGWLHDVLFTHAHLIVILLAQIAVKRSWPTAPVGIFPGASNVSSVHIYSMIGGAILEGSNACCRNLQKYDIKCQNGFFFTLAVPISYVLYIPPIMLVILFVISGASPPIPHFCYFLLRFNINLHNLT